MNVIEKIVLVLTLLLMLTVCEGSRAEVGSTYHEMDLYQVKCIGKTCMSHYLGRGEIPVDNDVLPGIEDMACVLFMYDHDGDGSPGKMILACVDPSFGEHSFEVTADNADKDDGNPQVQ